MVAKGNSPSLSEAQAQTLLSCCGIWPLCRVAMLARQQGISWVAGPAFISPVACCSTNITSPSCKTLLNLTKPCVMGRAEPHIYSKISFCRPKSQEADITTYGKREADGSGSIYLTCTLRATSPPLPRMHGEYALEACGWF